MTKDNKMMTRLILTIMMILPAFTMLAQDQTGRAREQVEAFRVAYYTRELNLSSSEAQQFWPVYNEYADELEENRSDQRNVQKSLRPGLYRWFRRGSRRSAHRVDGAQKR